MPYLTESVSQCVEQVEARNIHVQGKNIIGHSWAACALCLDHYLYTRAAKLLFIKLNLCPGKILETCQQIKVPLLRKNVCHPDLG